MKSLILVVVGVAIGALLAFGSQLVLNNGEAPGSGSGAAREPLYWVAPMDASYRRPGPGKSPMGMDLVPVYADAPGAAAGLVSIAPEVVNNLGVRTQPVRQRSLSGSVKTVGYVGYDEEHVLHVHPRVSGWVEKLYVKTTGERVRAGEPLYALYSPQLVGAQEEMLLAVERGEPQLIAAARERLRALRVPQSLLDSLEEGGAVEQTVTFLAPRSGVLENLSIREGFYVEPNSTLLSIAPLDPIWVEVEVFESQAAQIAEALPVTMTVPYLPGREWEGEVDYIYPTMDPQLRTLRMRLRFDNADRQLRPNMFVEVAIQTPPLRFLAVPEEAVIRLGDASRVVRKEGEGAFRSVPVHLGQSLAGYREVLHGLSDGDIVVTSAQFLLDSESSKAAEFERMQPRANPMPDMDHSMHDMHSGHDMSEMDDAESEMDHSMHDMHGGDDMSEADDAPPVMDHSMHDMSGGHEMSGEDAPATQGGHQHD